MGILEEAIKFLRESDRSIARSDLPQAERYLNRAISILARHTNEPETAVVRVRALRRLGDFYRGESRFKEARARFSEGLQLSHRFLGKSHIETALILNSIGVLGKYSGDYRDANRAYRRALRIATKHNERWLIATIYHNLGGLFHEQRRYSRAEPYARQSVRLRETLLGKNHPDVIADRAAYAAILQGQRRYSEALRIYERALKFYERQSNEYEIAINENNLAGLYFSLKKPEEARKHLLRSLALKLKTLGADHWDYAFTLCNLGILHRKLGETEEARRKLTEARRILVRRLGRNHAHVKLCSKHLALLKHA